MDNIVITNLSKSYGRKEVLHDINLTINRGMFGLLGRNGAGKTTLMRIIATLLNKNSGDIRVCDFNINESGSIRKIIGFLPQDFSMYPNMTVVETLDYLAVLSGIKMSERKARINDLIKKVNLTDHKHKRIKALSGGTKRRLGIAQALLNDPKVLIIDEPTTGLDPEERVRFRNLLSEVAEDRIVILSTHIVADIEAACEHIGILNEGYLLYDGTVTELLKQAEGSVYELTVDKNDVAFYRKNYMIISAKYVSNLTTLRIISDSTLQNAECVPPNVEDAYMLFLHREGVENNEFAS